MEVRVDMTENIRVEKISPIRLGQLRFTNGCHRRSRKSRKFLDNKWVDRILEEMVAAVWLT